jgi:hypothetical protein
VGPKQAQVSNSHNSFKDSRPRARKMVVPNHIYLAALNGDVDALRAYFASGDRDPNDTLERNGWTLLDGACAGRREVEVISRGELGEPVQTREQRVISCEAVSFLLSQGASKSTPPPRRRARSPATSSSTCSRSGSRSATGGGTCGATRGTEVRNMARGTSSTRVWY